MAAGDEKRRQRSVSCSKNVAGFERDQTAHAVAEQRVRRMMRIRHDLVGYNVSNAFDGVEQRLADPGPVAWLVQRADLDVCSQ